MFFIVFFGDVVQILDNGGSQEFSLRSETHFFKCGNRKNSICCKIRVEGWVWQRQGHHTIDYQDWNCFKRNAGEYLIMDFSERKDAILIELK